METINALENSKNITPQQKEILQDIQKQLSGYLGNAEQIANLEKQPQTPTIQAEKEDLAFQQFGSKGLMEAEALKL